MIGPVFFALIQISLEKGFYAGCAFAFGIMISDSVLIVFSFLGLSNILKSQKFNEILGIVGGLMLIIFGIIMLIKKSSNKVSKSNVSGSKSLINHVTSGFLLNALNPSVLLYWLVVVGSVSSQLKGKLSEITIFLVSTIITIFTTDILKAFGSDKLKSFISNKILGWFNKLSGVVFLIAGGKVLSNSLNIF